jgi:hypothetical protein
MAGDWIKLESVTPDKPEVHRIAALLGIDPDAVLGKLCRVWIWADQQTTDGNALSVTPALLDRVTMRDGFASALLHPDVKWLVQEPDGTVLFPHFDRHNGATAKRRALGNKRQQARRNLSRRCNADVTPEALHNRDQRREEKRREEESAPVSPPWKDLHDPELVCAYFREITASDPSPAMLSAWHGVMAELEAQHCAPNDVRKALKHYRDNPHRKAWPEARFLRADWFAGVLSAWKADGSDRQEGGNIY